jgi:transposase InsO family protein
MALLDLGVCARDALSNAISRHQPNTNTLMFHSDQGVQYCANAFVQYCKSKSITQSMSRRGNQGYGGTFHVSPFVTKIALNGSLVGSYPLFAVRAGVFNWTWVHVDITT